MSISTRLAPQPTRDRAYALFLAMHLIATLLVDAQAVSFAQRFSPRFLLAIFELAAQNDPLLSHANAPGFAWFQGLLVFEILVQLPLNALALLGLWNNCPSFFPVVAVYSATCVATTWACLATILSLPVTDQLPKLLASYLPFLIIPLVMTVDFSWRLSVLAGKSGAAEGSLKQVFQRDGQAKLD